MDPDRQIRLLIPPFFLFASLLLGGLSSDNQVRNWAAAATGEQLVAAGAALAASALPIGFVISSITFLVLRTLFLPSGRSFETHLGPAALNAVWPQLGTTLPAESRHAFFAAVTLDHELLSPGIHAWIMRRWNAFMICAQGCVALGLAHAIAYWLGIPQPSRWAMASAALCGLLFVNAVTAWRGTMEMLEFQAFRAREQPAPALPEAANTPLQPTSGGAAGSANSEPGGAARG